LVLLLDSSKKKKKKKCFVITGAWETEEKGKERELGLLFLKKLQLMIELKKKEMNERGVVAVVVTSQKGTSWPIPTDANGLRIKSPYYK